MNPRTKFLVMPANSSHCTSSIAMVFETDVRKRDGVGVNMEDTFVHDKRNGNIQERTTEQIAEQIVDVLVPHVQVDIIEVVQSIFRQRIAEQIVTIPMPRYAAKTQLAPLQRIQETSRGAVCGTGDASDHGGNYCDHAGYCSCCDAAAESNDSEGAKDDQDSSAAVH